MQHIRIVSRKSKLALVQANIVKQLLLNLYKESTIEIIGISTLGDQIPNKSLSEIGGKGLFIKALEVQLMLGNADIAVHSLKDLPASLRSEFTLAAFLNREDVTDAFISNKYNSLENLPLGAVIGTCSLRREAFLKKYYPHIQCKLLRGNVDTRLSKLDNGEYDGIILASAGIIRLGLDSRITQKLSVNQFIPSIGQGALVLEILSKRKDLFKILAPLNHTDTAIAVCAEREVGRYLGASCDLPIGVYACINNDRINISGMIANISSEKFYFAEASGLKKDSIKVATACAQSFLSQGADKILVKLDK